MKFGSVCSGIGRPAIDLTGRVFWRLTALGRSPTQPRNGRPRWVCRCECGVETTIPGTRLRGGSNKSCGCFRRDRAGQLYRTHGKSKTPQYTMFCDARKRAIALGLPFDIEPSDIEVPSVCPVLGVPLDGSRRDNKPSLDRKFPERGYVRGNVHVISFRANRIKSDATAAELRAVLSYAEAGNDD